MTREKTPAELRRRAAYLESLSRQTQDGSLACRLLIRALRMTAEASRAGRRVSDEDRARMALGYARPGWHPWR